MKITKLLVLLLSVVGISSLYCTEEGFGDQKIAPVEVAEEPVEYKKIDLPKKEDTVKVVSNEKDTSETSLKETSLKDSKDEEEVEEIDFSELVELAESIEKSGKKLG